MDFQQLPQINDLSRFAGAWTEEEAREFDLAVVFGDVDDPSNEQFIRDCVNGLV